MTWLRYWQVGGLTMLGVFAYCLWRREGVLERIVPAGRADPAYRQKVDGAAFGTLLLGAVAGVCWPLVIVGVLLLVPVKLLAWAYRAGGS